MDSRHILPVAESLLDQNFTAEAPNEVWRSDITYASTDEGRLYCAAHKDFSNGEIVGCALGPRSTKELVSRSLCNTVVEKRPTEEPIHHSDRGSQYTALMNYIKPQLNLSAEISPHIAVNNYPTFIWTS